MEFNKAKIEGAIYEVVTLEQYYANRGMYDRFTAIDGQDGYLYPIRGRNDYRPGAYCDDCLAIFKPPATDEMPRYSANNIINFSSNSTIEDIINAEARLSAEERSILTTVNSYTKPEILSTDSPAMAGLKEAIREKDIDLDSYGYRFGANFNNDKRLLNKSDISLKKLESMAKCLDIKLTLTFEDASDDVVNPIGHAITVDLTGEDESDE